MNISESKSTKNRNVKSYQDLRDKFLIARARKGDNLAFEAIVNRYKNQVFTSAFFIMGNSHDASDAAQEVFLKIYKSLHKFGGRSKFSTWLFRVTTNTCIDLIRKRKRITHKTKELDLEKDKKFSDRLNIERFSSVESEFLKSEDMKRIIESIISLPVKYRVPIVLRDIYGYSYREIAKYLKQPLGTLKCNIFRGRRLLRDIIYRKT